MELKFVELLVEGDLRTTGKSPQVVEAVLQNPERFGELFACLVESIPGVRMRASDAIDKISRVKPQLLSPYKSQLVSIAQTTTQQEVQWHLAQIATSLEFSDTQKNNLYQTFLDYYSKSPSNIVKTFSLTALVHLARKDKQKTEQVNTLLKQAQKNASPAVKSRAEALLKKL